MGRADLARHRKVSPSDARPFNFPSSAEWVLSRLETHPHKEVTRTIASVRDAATLRAQISAVKMLGVVMRDAHNSKDDHRGRQLCSCLSSQHPQSGHFWNTQTSSCALVSSVLVSIIFEKPGVPTGLVSTALRAVSRSQTKIHGFQEAVDNLSKRLTCLGTEKKMEVKNQQPNYFSGLAADAVTSEAILADAEFRHLILDFPERIYGVLEMISRVVKVYSQLVNKSNQPEPGQAKQHDQISSSAEQETQPSYSRMVFSRQLLDSACDASMKAAQDVLNAITRNSSSSDQINPKLKNNVVGVVESCSSILNNVEVPRICTMACAIAYLTGLLWTRDLEETPECISSCIHIQIFSRLYSFPAFSQLCLLRAVMEAPISRLSLPLILVPQNGLHPERGETVFDHLVRLVSRNSDVHMRFLAMDAIIECLRRYMPKKLDPSCINVVLNLIYERCQEPFPGVSSQIKESLEVLISVAGDDEETSIFWADMLTTLAIGKWHMKGTYAPLSVLVKRMGARKLLKIEPKCQILAIYAAASNSRLAKAVSEWLGTFWKSLRSECESKEGLFAILTHDTLLSSLTEEKRPSLHQCMLDLILPAFFKSGTQSQIETDVGLLLHQLSNLDQTNESSKMRGTVNILSVARKQGLEITSFKDTTIVSLLQSALKSGEEDVRASALDLVVTSKSTTKPIEEVELNLITNHMPVALAPFGQASNRSRFRQSMRRFFARLLACRNAAADGSGGWWIKERKQNYDGNRTSEFEEIRSSLLSRLDIFEKNCVVLLLGSCYPGASFQRRSLALEVLQEFVKLFEFGAISYTLPNFYNTAVCSILQCCLDDWDRTRRSAYDVIDAFPDPLPGFETLEQVDSVHNFAHGLLKSPYQKIVDGGALLCRAMFQTCQLRGQMQFIGKQDFLFHNQDHSLPLRFSPSNASIESNISHYGDTDFSYPHTILNSIEKVATTASKDLSSSCEQGLFYGHFLVLRYSIQDLKWAQLCMETNVDVMGFVNRLISIAASCIHIAMEGVSYASMQYENLSEIRSVDSSTKGANGLLVQYGKQVKRTSCFLSIKEICVLLGMLCHNIPIADPQEEDQSSILDHVQLETITELFLHIFKSTRHWGVIDGAQEGFQLLCERMLISPDMKVRSLPAIYASKTLSAALSGELYVLRRSAGIPSLILATLNAEAAQNKRSFASPILNTIVSKLLNHLQEAGVYDGDANLGEIRSKREESIAHALNLLRSLFLNSRIAGNILKHLEQATIWCIRAFCSKSWLIKNSAMMLYSALMRRGIGPCAERKVHASSSSFEVAEGTSSSLEGERRTHGVTVFQFFSRHPQLHPFLLRQLEVAISQRKNGNVEDHPTLFPTLHLLSSLTPAAGDDPSSSLSVSPFRPLVQECMRWSSDYVRRAAAVAFVPLIDDPSHVAYVIEGLFNRGVLRECSSEMLETTEMKKEDIGNESSQKKLRITRQNDLHGELLQIAAILKGTRQFMSGQDRVNTLSVIAHFLPSKCWIAYDGVHNPCSYTRESMLVIIIQAYHLCEDIQNTEDMPSSAQDDAHILIDLCSKMAKRLQTISLQNCGFGAEIAISALRSRACELLARTTMRACCRGKISLQAAMETLITQVNTSTHETQKVGLSYITPLLSMLDNEHRAKQSFPQASGLIISTYQLNVWRLMQNLLRSSDDHELIVKSLQVSCDLLSYMDQHKETCETELLTTDVSDLISNARTHPCIDVREHILVLLSYLLKIAEREDFIDPWMTLAKEAHSAPVTTTRLAASKGLITAIPGLSAKNAVTAQLLLARLLEDEDKEVRRVASGANLSPLIALRSLYITLATSRDGQEGLLRQLVIELESVGIGCEANEVLAAIADSLGITKQLISSNELKRDVMDGDSDTNDADNDEYEDNLFELEDTTPSGENLLRLQLCTLTICRLLQGHPTDDKRWESGAKVAAKAIDDTVIGSCILEKKMYTSSGFAYCYASVLLCMFGVCGGRIRATAAIVREMSSSLKRYSRDMHPIITLVIDGLRAVAGGVNALGEPGVTSTGVYPLRQILFLLPGIDDEKSYIWVK